jgi:hypothetical protein
MTSPWPKPTGDVLADMHALLEALPSLPPRIERIFVRDAADYEQVRGKCGALLDRLPVIICPYLTVHRGLIMFSDGTVKIFRVGDDE